LKLLTYFISPTLYFVVVVFFSVALSLFFVRDDVIFLSDDGRRRRRLRHSRCSSLALFSFFPFLFFGRLFLDAHLVVTLFVNKLIHRILRHAHLPIIRNDHSINTTTTNQPTNQPSIINANRRKQVAVVKTFLKFQITRSIIEDYSPSK
jgi:hypothetical protein